MPDSVRDAMSSPPVVLSEDASLIECARLMRSEDVGALGVTRDGALSGVVTDRDIVTRGLTDGRALKGLRAADVASRPPVVVPPECPLDDAERLMAERRVRRLFVVDGGTPCGVVSVDDIAVRRDSASVQARQLEAGGHGLLRGYQGHTGQME